MIPILYKSTEKNFNHNGIGFLRDTIFCNVTEERNGLYELELIYPVGSFLYEEITKQRIIKAKSNDRYDSQLFRIYYISKPLDGQIKVKAEHISYDNRRNFIEKVNFSGNCGGALSALKANASYQCPFNFLSDLNISKQFSVERVNILNAIVGANGSIMDTYGNNSDIVRDNFNISIKKEGGLDKNVLICYRKNITGFECEDDDSEVITQIYPFAKVDEEIITLPEKFVSSEYLSKFPNPIICEVDLSSDDVTDIETLRQKANNYFKLTKRDIPKFNYKIDFISLSKTENYKDLKLAEDIGICDYVIVRHESYNINEKHKVIKTVYDTLAENYESIELGEPKTDLNTIIGNMNNDIKDEINKDKITPGFLDQAIENLTNAITGNDGGYIRLNPPKNPSEILILDNEDINQARIVWRWNKAGLGVSNSGYNGNFIGLTRDGKLVIDEATANKINAALIEAGTITANHLSVTAKEELKKGLVTTANFEVALNNIKLEVSENYASKTSVENLSKALEEAKKNLKGEISDVSSNLNNLEENINGAFKDGIINEAEAIAIYEQIRQLDKEKLDIDKKYDAIYTNTELKGTVKTNLESAKTNYINAHSSLKTTINNAISDKVITLEENIDVNNKFNEYNQKLSEFSKVLEQAIDAIGSEKVKKLETSTNDKISKIEVNTDGIKQTVNEVQSTVTTHTTQISSVTQKASSLETNLTGITGRVSSVETKTNTIDGKVTNQETRLAEAEQKITTDGIFNTVKNKLTLLSGNNLIPNSVGRLGQKYWNVFKHHGYGSVENNLYNTIDNSRDGLQFLVRNNTGTFGGLLSHSIPVKDNTKYTITAEIEEHRGSHVRVEIMCWDKIVDEAVINPNVAKLHAGNLYQRREESLTFTTPSNTRFINIYLWSEYTQSSSEYNYGHFWIRKLRLNEGEISHPWCESNTFSESNIAQTSEHISLKVNRNDVSSIIEQNPNSVKIGFNSINNNFEITPSEVNMRGSNGKKHLGFRRGKMYTYSPIDGTELGHFGMNRWNNTNNYGLVINQDIHSFIALGKAMPNVYEAYLAMNCGGIPNVQDGIQLFSNMYCNQRLVENPRLKWYIDNDIGEIYLYNSSGSSQMRVLAGDDDVDEVFLGVKMYYDTTIRTLGTFSKANIDFYNNLDMHNWSISNTRIKANQYIVNDVNRKTKNVVEQTLTQTITPNTEYLGSDKVINGECIVRLPNKLIGMSNEYIVILVAIGDNHIYLEEKNEGNFIVKGDDCTFDYVIKYKIYKNINKATEGVIKYDEDNRVDQEPMRIPIENPTNPYQHLYYKNSL